MLNIIGKILLPQKSDITLTHYQILELLHKKLKPRTYLEIGVQEGRSIILANKKTEIIGIDPNNILKFKLGKNTNMFFDTSDNFFEKTNVYEKFGGKKIDLAFIDGMHLFEFVLRDFINVEKNCHKNSIILLHDTIPIDAISSSRQLQPTVWTGDVFKIILILKKYRPDLEIYNISTPPIGVCLVKNLNHENNVLKENYDKIFEDYLNITFDNIKDDLKGNLSILDFALQDIETLI